MTKKQIRKWTEDEVVFLINNYATMSAVEIGNLLSRSARSIYNKTTYLGLFKRQSKKQNDNQEVDDTPNAFDPSHKNKLINENWDKRKGNKKVKNGEGTAGGTEENTKSELEQLHDALMVWMSDLVLEEEKQVLKITTYQRNVAAQSLEQSAQKQLTIEAYEKTLDKLRNQITDLALIKTKLPKPNYKDSTTAHSSFLHVVETLKNDHEEKERFGLMVEAQKLSALHARERLYAWHQFGDGENHTEVDRPILNADSMELEEKEELNIRRDDVLNELNKRIMKEGE